MTIPVRDVYLALFEEPPLGFRWDNPGVVYDRFGHTVDTRGDVWELTDPTLTTRCYWDRVNNDTSNLEALKAYMAYCIEVKAAHTATNTFKFYKQASTIEDFRKYPLSINDMLTVLDKLRGSDSEWVFHWIRKWYAWCADVEIPGFSQDISDELSKYSIMGNEKGVAVLTDDEEAGPLDNVEYDLLRSKIKSGVGSDLERICVMLCMEIGGNPKNLVLLEERDFVKKETSSGGCFYSLLVPRVKKRLSSREVRIRKVSQVLGREIERFIEANHIAYGRPYGIKSPIVRRDKKRRMPTRTLQRFQFHMSTQDFSRVVVDYSKNTKIISPRTGSTLLLTPRRLRYTFATRLVEQGAPPAVVADALDHTDLQHVGVYFKARGKAVEDLNRALECNPHYMDTINRFSGVIVERQETEGLHTVPGETLTYRDIGGIGGCGAKFLCKLYPPLSCYLCPSFHAWKDGPHQEMLDELRKRAREVAVTSGYPVARMANQVDDVIQAISQLLQRIEEIG